MNIYDTANRLASEIKTSEEYMNYKMAREVINLKPDLKEEISKERQKQINKTNYIEQTKKHKVHK